MINKLFFINKTKWFMPVYKRLNKQF